MELELTNHFCTSTTLMQELGIRSINHVYHEVNQCADGMTNFVTEVKGNSCLAFNECPTEVVGKFLDDFMGVPYPIVIFEL